LHRPWLVTEKRLSHLTLVQHWLLLLLVIMMMMMDLCLRNILHAAARGAVSVVVHRLRGLNRLRVSDLLHHPVVRPAHIHLNLMLRRRLLSGGRMGVVVMVVMAPVMTAPAPSSPRRRAGRC